MGNACLSSGPCRSLQAFPLPAKYLCIVEKDHNQSRASQSRKLLYARVKEEGFDHTDLPVAAGMSHCFVVLASFIGMRDCSPHSVDFS